MPFASWQVPIQSPFPREAAFLFSRTCTTSVMKSRIIFVPAASGAVPRGVHSLPFQEFDNPVSYIVEFWCNESFKVVWNADSHHV